LPRNRKVAAPAPPGVSHASRALCASRTSALAGLATFAVCLGAGLAAPRTAMAGNMDLTPERLAICTGNSCIPNNVPWANLMGEMGMVIAPTAFHAARTTGLGGFALSLETSFTHVNADASAGGVQYWHAGTQGPRDPDTHQFSIVNGSPDSLIGVYSLKARKGLAYGFEIAGDLGYVANTSLWVGGADIRWAILEGYRTGVLGYFPDIAIGGGVRTVGGSPKFFLTTVGLDAQISKPISFDEGGVLTPYVGAQRVLIFADSSVVDLTPNADPLNCGYLGPNVPGNKNATPANLSPNQMPNDGTPICKGDNSDFNNDTTFRRARIQNWRGIVGVNYRYEVLYLASQFAWTLESPSNNENRNIGVDGAQQWTLSFEAGVSF
jgi:hypothetical protein